MFHNIRDKEILLKSPTTFETPIWNSRARPKAFHPADPCSIPGNGNIFKKSQIFLFTRGFQKFWQKTWNQQLLFYYSMRKGKNWIVAPSSDSKKATIGPLPIHFFLKITLGNFSNEKIVKYYAFAFAWDFKLIVWEAILRQYCIAQNKSRLDLQNGQK